MCKLLVEKGADVTVVNNQGKNVVEIAKKNKHQELIDFLSSETKRIK